MRYKTDLDAVKHMPTVYESSERPDIMTYYGIGNGEATTVKNIKSEYRDYAEAEGINGEVRTDEFLSMLDTLQEILEGGKFIDISNTGMEIARAITDYFNELVNEDNKAFVNGKNVEIEKLGSSAAADIRAANPLKILF